MKACIVSVIAVLSLASLLSACKGNGQQADMQQASSPQTSTQQPAPQQPPAQQPPAQQPPADQPPTQQPPADQPPAQQPPAQAPAKDPGVRGGDPGVGGPISGLTISQRAAFEAGAEDFAAAEEVVDGLGPMMNLDSCGGCHIQPANGGTSPAVNPQIAFASLDGATNVIPSFLSANGPVREARFVRNADGSPDGGVHALFTITGRADAPGCMLAQPDFAAAVAANNVIFRIPTPIFGMGLIEAIPDGAIFANATSVTTQSLRRTMGIRGRANVVVTGNTISGTTNRNGNDGTIARFGWKAQNKSALLFAAEAYNVEMGISNDILPTERSEDPACQGATTPNDGFNLAAVTATDATPAIQLFTNFMRLSAPPMPSTTTPGGAQSIANGRALFSQIGCAVCHTPSFMTGQSFVRALSNRQVNLFSDLLVHD